MTTFQIAKDLARAAVAFRVRAKANGGARRGHYTRLADNMADRARAVLKVALGGPCNGDFAEALDSHAALTRLYPHGVPASIYPTCRC